MVCTHSCTYLHNRMWRHSGFYLKVVLLWSPAESGDDGDAAAATIIAAAARDVWEKSHTQMQ